jgi:hypothetical protein
METKVGNRIERVNGKQAKTIAELCEDGSEVTIEDIRVYAGYSNFLLVTKYKPSDGLGSLRDRGPAFIVDQNGGYYRLPDKD